MLEIAKYIADTIYKATENVSNSGRLLRSIQGGYEVKGGIKTIFVEANRYFNFIDRGVSGNKRNIPNTPYKYKDKRPPQQALYQYLKNKGVADKEANNGAWALQKYIWQNGIEAKNILDPTIDSISDEVTKRIATQTRSEHINRISKWL